MSLSVNKTLALSISRAGCFQKCPRNFHYRYVQKLPDVQTYEASLGSLFHYVLDFWAVTFLKTKNLRESMMQGYLDAKKQWKKEDKTPLSKDDLELVKKWIRGYLVLLEQDLPKILGHEYVFNFTINSRYRIRGAIDRIDEVDENTIRIVDYKAGSSRYIDNKQVCVYAKALIDTPKYKGKKFIGTYIFVKEDCKIIEYDLTDTLINQTVEYLKDIGESIIIENQWNPKVSPLCGWCSYKFQCANDNNNVGVFECL